MLPVKTNRLAFNQNCLDQPEKIWTPELERELVRKLWPLLENKQMVYFIAVLAKECYEVGWTVKSCQALATLSGLSVSTVKRYLIELESRRFIRRAPTMSRKKKWNSVNLVVMNWGRIDYHPPRRYDISSLQTLQHINLINPSDRFWINSLFQAHNKAREAIENNTKPVHKYKRHRSKINRLELTGSNVISPKVISEKKPQFEPNKKIDKQQAPAHAATWLSNLIENLAKQFLGCLDRWGFNATWYIKDPFNRDNIIKAYCKVLWRLHRIYGTDDLIKGCFYAFSNISLFHYFESAKRLEQYFDLILYEFTHKTKETNFERIAQNTHPCRRERFELCQTMRSIHEDGS